MLAWQARPREGHTGCSKLRNSPWPSRTSMPDERHAFEHASLKHSQPARRHDRPHGVSARLEVVDRCWGRCSAPAAEGLMVGAVEPGDELAGGRPMDQVGATVVRILVGRRLRRLREAARVTADQAAEIRASCAKMSRMETGGSDSRPATWPTCSPCTASPADRSGRAAELARRPTPGWWTDHSDMLPGWFEAYLGLDDRVGHPHLRAPVRARPVPDPEELRPRGSHARHQRAPAWEIDSRVSLRMKRQDLLAAAARPGVVQS